MPGVRPQLAAQPVPPAREMDSAPLAAEDSSNRLARSGAGPPDELIALQRAADAAHSTLQSLRDDDDRARQRRVCFEAAAEAQAAVTQYARIHRLNRYEVEKQLRRAVRQPVR